MIIYKWLQQYILGEISLIKRSQTLKMFFKFAKLWTDASTAIHKSLFVQQLFLNSSLTISNVHLVHSGYASSLFRTELARQMIPTYNPLPKTSAKTSALISSASNCQDCSTQGAQIRKRKTAKNDPVEAHTTIHTNATKHFICRENTVDVRVQLWDQTNRFLGVLIFFSAKVPSGISFNFWNIHTAIQTLGSRRFFLNASKVTVQRFMMLLFYYTFVTQVIYISN